MGIEVAALMGFFGLTSAFALVAAIFAAWMAWRIVEKAGFPGWTGLGGDPSHAHRRGLDRAAGAVVGLRLHALAARRRDKCLAGLRPAHRPARPVRPPAALAPPSVALADRRGWRLTGSLPKGGSVALVVHHAATTYVLTGAAATQPGELSVPDPRSASRMRACSPRRAGSGWRISARPAEPSSTGRACCPSTARATSVPPARSAWAVSN